MPIEFRCEKCSNLLRTPDEAAGRQARCPNCGNIQGVPGVVDSHINETVEEPQIEAPPDVVVEDPDVGIDSSEAESPSVAPSPVNEGDVTTRAEALAKVRRPAIALIIVGALEIMLSLFFVLIAFINLAEGRGDDAGGGFVGAVMVGVHSLVAIASGASMYKLKNFRVTLVLTIMAAFPCCCVINLPIGIWGIVTILNDQVKSSFQ